MDGSIFPDGIKKKAKDSGFPNNQSCLYSDLNLISDRLQRAVKFDTVTDMRAADITKLKDGQPVEWLGYYAANDGGGNKGIYSSASIATDDGGSIFDITAGGQVVSELLGKIDVKKFGSVGDGVSDDTDAITNAWDYCIELINSNTTIAGWDKQIKAALNFSNGDYIYNGTGLTEGSGNPSIQITGDGRSITRIHLGDSSFLFNLSLSPSTFDFTDLTVIGGKGCYYENAPTSVSGGITFDRCSFFNFTQSAIGFANKNADRPRVTLNNCEFSADSNSDSFAIVLPAGGGHSINNCWFNEGRVDIKFSSYIFGGECVIENCRFGRRSTQIGNRTRIWLTGGSFPKEGQGIIIKECVFGNENVSSLDTYVLIADGDGNTDSTLELPDYSSNTSPITNLRIKDCNIQGNETFAPSLIDTYTKNIKDCEFTGIYFSDSRPMTVINDVIGGSFGLPDARTNVFDYKFQGQTSQSEDLKTGFPNIRLNEYGLSQTTDSTIHGGGYDSGFHEMLKTRNLFTSLSLGGTTTKTQTEDSLGGNQAAIVTINESNARLTIQDADINGTGDVVWIEFDVKKSLVNTASYAVFQYQVSGSNVQQKRVIELTDDWSRVRFPIIQEIDGQNVTLAWYAFTGVQSGVDDQYVIGVPAVYRSRSPQPYYGHVRAIDSDWDKTHIILGTYHLWVDSLGVLRIKNAAPTSDTDGTIVGSQT